MNHYQLGRRMLDRSDPASARRYFEAGLTAGDPRCAYGLVALAAMSGEPMEKPLEQLHNSLPAIEALADRADADACFILGRCYETGSAVQQSLPHAIRWYLQAASLGSADAMFNLGCIYMAMGPEAEKLALDQFQQAADHGCHNARLALEHYRRHQRQH